MYPRCLAQVMCILLFLSMVESFWFFSCPRGNGKGQAGDVCSAFCQCQSPNTCEAGVQRCYAPGLYGEQCHATRPCGAGLSCHPGVQRCFHLPRRMYEPCVAGYECASGLACEPGVQVCFHRPRQLREPCAAGYSCGYGLNCHPGVQRCYHYPRLENEPCSAGYACADGLSCSTCGTGIAKCQLARMEPFQDEDYKRPYNKVAFLVTHNAHAQGNNFAIWARNQEYSVTKQLQDGVRGLMLDIYPGWGRVEVRLCHASCYWSGSSSLLSTLVEIRHFLDNHPKEVVTIIFEDYLKNPTLLKNIFDRADISRHVLPSYYWGFGSNDWPTLEAMRTLGRLVVFDNNGLSGFPYTELDMWYFVRENHYGESGRNTKTCVDRSQSLKNINFNSMWSIVLVNWFPTIPTPLDPCVNSFTDIKAKLETCQHTFDHRPNFLAVDYYSRSIGGGAFQAVKWLNSQWRGEQTFGSSKRSDILSSHYTTSNKNSTGSSVGNQQRRTFYRSTTSITEAHSSNDKIPKILKPYPNGLKHANNQLKSSLKNTSTKPVEKVETEHKTSSVDRKGKKSGVNNSDNVNEKINSKVKLTRKGANDGSGDIVGISKFISKSRAVVQKSLKGGSSNGNENKTRTAQPNVGKVSGGDNIKGNKIQKLKVVFDEMNAEIPQRKVQAADQKEVISSGRVISSGQGRPGHERLTDQEGSTNHKGIFYHGETASGQEGSTYQTIATHHGSFSGQEGPVYHNVAMHHGESFSGQEDSFDQEGPLYHGESFSGQEGSSFQVDSSLLSKDDIGLQSRGNETRKVKTFGKPNGGDSRIDTSNINSSVKDTGPFSDSSEVTGGKHKLKVVATNPGGMDLKGSKISPTIPHKQTNSTFSDMPYKPVGILNGELPNKGTKNVVQKISQNNASNSSSNSSHDQMTSHKQESVPNGNKSSKNSGNGNDKVVSDSSTPSQEELINEMLLSNSAVGSGVNIPAERNTSQFLPLSLKNHTTLSKLFHNSTGEESNNSTRSAGSELVDFFDDGRKSADKTPGKTKKANHMRVARTTTTMSPLATSTSARPQVHFFQSNDESIK